MEDNLVHFWQINPDDLNKIIVLLCVMLLVGSTIAKKLNSQ